MADDGMKAIMPTRLAFEREKNNISQLEIVIHFFFNVNLPEPRSRDR